MAEKSTLTYRVYCHVCPIDAPILRRCDALLHGSPDWGGLWHCPDHARCTYCAHDRGYCDKECAQPRPSGNRE